MNGVEHVREIEDVSRALPVPETTRGGRTSARRLAMEQTRMLEEYARAQTEKAQPQAERRSGTPDERRPEEEEVIEPATREVSNPRQGQPDRAEEPGPAER